MKSYNTFAKFYDELTDNVEYEKRSKYIYDFFKENCANCNSVLDLACGTGSVSEYLADMGMDLSDEMLTEACLKGIKRAVFIKGDMTCFTLPQKVDCCICSLDSINHLKDIGEVRKCFDCVYNSLDNGGVLFLMSTRFISINVFLQIILLYLMKKISFYHGIMNI